MQAIMDAADHQADGETIALHLLQLRTVPDCAADDILEWMDGKEQEQWSREYTLAYLPA